MPCLRYIPSSVSGLLLMPCLRWILLQSPVLILVFASVPLYFQARPARSSPWEELSLYTLYAHVVLFLIRIRRHTSFIDTQTFALEESSLFCTIFLTAVLPAPITRRHQSVWPEINALARKLVILELEPMINHKLATLDISVWFFQA